MNNTAYICRGTSCFNTLYPHQLWNDTIQFSWQDFSGLIFQDFAQLLFPVPSMIKTGLVVFIPVGNLGVTTGNSICGNKSWSQRPLRTENKTNQGSAFRVLMETNTCALVHLFSGSFEVKYSKWQSSPDAHYTWDDGLSCLQGRGSIGEKQICKVMMRKGKTVNQKKLNHHGN